MKDAGPLRKSIIEWSRVWSLNADWCRDFGVVALCDWLEDRYLQYQLQWSERYLSFRNAIWTVHREDFWGTYDLITVSEEHEGLQSLLGVKFKFSWENLSFQHIRWNPLARYKDEWEEECEKEFKAYLRRRDEREETVPKGVLVKYRAVRTKYVKKIDTAAREAVLARTPRRWADDHLAYAVHFHVQKWSLSKIAKTYSKSKSAIAEGIDVTLNMIGLTKRPENRAGRKRGTKSPRRLSAHERADKLARLPKFIKPLENVNDPQNKAEVARAIKVSENYFRRVSIPELIKRAGCRDYHSLVRKYSPPPP
jgi:hypothetical protein